MRSTSTGTINASLWPSPEPARVPTTTRASLHPTPTKISKTAAAGAGNPSGALWRAAPEPVRFATRTTTTWNFLHPRTTKIS
jgi:hypothetical protein